MSNLFSNSHKQAPVTRGSYIVRSLLVWMLLLTGFFSRAQFPVQVTPQLLAPYTVFLNQYYTGTQPKIIVTLINRDLQRPVVDVRLRMTLKGQQVVLSSKDNVFYPSISLTAGVPQRLSLNDLAPYFNPANLNIQGISLSDYQQQGRIPEGAYQFCFEAVETTTGQVVSRNECAYAFISLADPPMLNLPGKDSEVDFAEPSNISFTWTPRFVQPTIEYNFQLCELLDVNISPEVAFRTAQPLYSTTTAATSLLYGPGQPLLITGKKYGWRVQAKNTDQADGQSIFKNDGFSEVYWFTYTEPCRAPRNITKTISNGAVTLQWPAVARTKGYRIEYKNEDQPLSPWVTATTTLNSFKITDAAEDESYVYRIGNKCTANGNYIYSDTSHFVVKPVLNPYAATGNISWVYKLTEETADNANDSLVSKTKKDNALSTNPVNHKAGKTAYGLRGASIAIFCRYEVRGWGGSTNVIYQQVAQDTADASGNYNVVLRNVRAGAMGYIQVSHPSGLFNKILRRDVVFVQTPSGFRMGNDTLTAQSFQFKPSVFIPNYVDADPVSIDVLLPKPLFLQMRFMENAGLGDLNKQVMYNNDPYILLTTLYDGKAFKKLLYNSQASQHYVIRVNYQNKPAVFYPMDAMLATSDANGQKPVKLLKKQFNYVIKTVIEGIVTYKNRPRRDVKIGIFIKKADILGDYPGTGNTQTVVNFPATTDAAGRYSYETLPPIKKGAFITMNLDDHSLRQETFPTNIVYDGSYLVKKDYELINNVHTITGRLLDQDSMPIANASVRTTYSQEQTRTTDRGYFMVKAYTPGDVIFNVDMYKSKSVAVAFDTNNYIHPGDVPLSPGEWKEAVQNSNTFKNKLQELPGHEVTADVLGIGTGSLPVKYFNYFGQEETLKSVVDSGAIVMQVAKGTLTLKAYYHGELVKAKVKLSNGFEGTTTAGEGYNVSLQGGHYSVQVSTWSNLVTFVPFFGEFDIIINQNTTIEINLSDGVLLSGIIKDKETSKPVEEALVEVTGTPYTALANEKGEFSFIVPAGQEFEYHLSQKKYNSWDTSFITNKRLNLNLRLEMRDSSAPVLITLSGFPIKIDKQATGVYGTYIISGKLKTKYNELFSNDADTSGNELTFRDVAVKLDKKTTGNAIPLNDVLFEEAVMQTKVFGFASVEVAGFPQIMMKGMAVEGQDSRQYTAIGGSSLKALLSDYTGTGPVPLKLKDATIKNKDKGITEANETREKQGLQPFYYVYSSPGYNINALSKKQRFKLEFDSTIGSVSTATGAFIKDTAYKYAETSMGFKGDRIATLYINRKTGEMGDNGLDLDGFVKFNKQIQARLPDSGKVSINKLKLSKTFAIDELTFSLSDSNYLFIRIQKLNVELSKMSFFGIGTPNFGVGFGGTCYMAKANPKKYPDTLSILNLSIKASSEGPVFDGKFALPKQGVSIKSLIISTIGNGYFAFSFDIPKKSYIIEAADLQLGFVPSRSPKPPGTSDGSSSALKSVFPILIQSLKLDLVNWNLFMAARTNIKIDFKVVKLNVERLLVCVGYNKTMDEMNAYLTAPIGTRAAEIKPEAGPEDEPLDEVNTSWAIGIAGKIDFGVSGIKSSLGGSFLIGNINDEIQVRLNEIELKMENQAFKLAAKVKIQFSGTKQGFEAEAALTTIKKDFEASFKFYYLSATATTPAGIEMGAKIKVSAGITTGPLIWHSIGGGFDFNTVSNTYMVFLTGDVGPAGTPKEVGYVKDAYIKILFDVNNCSAYPVIEGGGKIVMKEKEWGQVGAKVDFCRNLLLVTIGLQLPAAPGLNIYVTGVLYGMTRNVNGKQTGALFLGVNANISSMGDMINGNIFLAVGVNYNNNDPLSPQEVKNLWNNIDDEAKDNNNTELNAVFIGGMMNVPSKNGSFSINIGGFDLIGFSYDFSATAHAVLFVKYNSNLFRFRGDLEAHANGSLTFLGCSLYGSGAIKVSLNGGYDGSWYVNGAASLQLSLYSDPEAGCNSVRTTWHECCCVDWDVPCCTWPCIDCSCSWDCKSRTCIPYPTFGFKVCTSLNAGFNYRQGQPTNIYFN